MSSEMNLLFNESVNSSKIDQSKNQPYMLFPLLTGLTLCLTYRMSKVQHFLYKYMLTVLVLPASAIILMQTCFLSHVVTIRTEG